MFESPDRLLLGLLTGLVFGFLLQKGKVAKHSVIVGQLIMRNHTVVKIMLTAVAVGAAGFWTLAALGLTPVDVKPAEVGGVLLGSLLFGVGLAVLGYCPGTTMAAVGEGNRDAAFGVLGMLAGAFVFVRFFPTVETAQTAIANWGKLTLPAATSVPAPAWVGLLVALALTLYVHTRRRRGHRLSAAR
jgi:uncharacterized membrane protein YedE/YeeE